MALSTQDAIRIDKSEWRNPPISIRQPPVYITRQPWPNSGYIQ